MPLIVMTFSMVNDGTLEGGVGYAAAGVEGHCPLATSLLGHGPC